MRTDEYNIEELYAYVAQLEERISELEEDKKELEAILRVKKEESDNADQNI